MIECTNYIKEILQDYDAFIAKWLNFYYKLMTTYSFN